MAKGGIYRRVVAVGGEIPGRGGRGKVLEQGLEEGEQNGVLGGGVALVEEASIGRRQRLGVCVEDLLAVAGWQQGTSVPRAVATCSRAW